MTLARRPRLRAVLSKPGELIKHPGKLTATRRADAASIKAEDAPHPDDVGG